MKRDRLRPVPAAIVCIVLACIPLVAGNFTVSLFNDIGIGALVALGLVLLTGVGGATSFGQAAFVGIAAYASAWLTTGQGLSPWFGLAFALALTGLSLLFSMNLLRSRPGRAIRGLRGGTILLASVGADAHRVRLWLFVLAALLAGLAGWLYAHTNRFVSPSPFDVRASIEYLLMAVAGGVGHLVGALLGSGLVLVLKNTLQDVLPMITQRAGQIEAIVFMALFIALLHFARGGLMGYVSRWWRRRPRKARRTPLDDGPVEPLARREMPPRGSPVLSVQGVVKRFGGLRFEGEDLHGLDVEARVERGLCLVPERRELFGELSVLDNLRLGAYSRRLRPDALRRRLDAVHARFPRLAERRGQRADTLSGGERQMLAVGRALMSAPWLLMLDEPSLGLAPLIVAEILAIVRSLRDDGVSILLVEQNARAALESSDHGYVLETGEIALSGDSGSLADDPRVRQTYLGGGPDDDA